MTAILWCALALAVGLGVYLACAMLNAEDF
jgi:K+-transporting ATPase KdpF subunit